jgi:methionyl-tRNA formyltransferase
MKIVLACRDGPSSYYVAGRLARKGLLNAVIVESGKTARKNKIDRIFQRSAFWQTPGIVLNFAFLSVYRKLQKRAMRNIVAAEELEMKFPDGIQQFHVDDINEMSCKEFLEQQIPDYLVVMGTALLETRIIDIPSIATLNIHGGLVPKYRNVHSDFWAYLDNDHDNIGTSILYLDKGIDTGDVVCQSSAGVDARDGLFVAKQKNLSLAGDLIESALTQKELIDNRRVQDKELQQFFPTPGNRAFMRLLWKVIRRKLG